MTGGTSAEEQRRGIARALASADLRLDELYVRYFALGGTAGLVELEGFLAGMLALPPGQRDMLAHAVNERLAELAPVAPAPYSRHLRRGAPHAGPLAALVALLNGARLAPPEDLPSVAAEAGRALDTEVVVHLVDLAQRELVALPAPGLAGGREPLPVDGTLAGRAFQRTEVVASSEGAPRLWVPLVDGAERLGVLEVLVRDSADLSDRLLREQLRWVAAQLGHLVAALSEYGDALRTARLREPRTPAAELIWSLLPPLAAATAGFSVAGLVELSSRVGGDAFDYALARSRVSLAIFDGMGHGLPAGLMASAALAASRTARREGRGLYAQGQAVDDVLATAFDDALVTGVLAELDIESGRLRYLVAGHPAPLLLRQGSVVKALGGGRRTPFGIDGHELTLGEEHLEPGDWVVLHTDGVTEARDPEGGFFGERRLVDVLEREAASGHPPAETVRRVVRSVLDHQRGVLQDDATVLLARWDASGVPERGPLV